MSSYPRLVGEVDTREVEVQDLRRRLLQIEEELRVERVKSVRIEAALRELRHLTSPFQKLLNAIHGGLDDLGIDPSVSESSQPKKEVWAIWKQKLGNQCARIIDALLTHGSMTRSQLIIATGISGGNIAKPISRLNTANLINKNGDSISLKQI
jgi:hypothetical protein